MQQSYKYLLAYQLIERIPPAHDAVMNPSMTTDTGYSRRGQRPGLATDEAFH